MPQNKNNTSGPYAEFLKFNKNAAKFQSLFNRNLKDIEINKKNPKILANLLQKDRFLRKKIHNINNQYSLYHIKNNNLPISYDNLIPIKFIKT